MLTSASLVLTFRQVLVLWYVCKETLPENAGVEESVDAFRGDRRKGVNDSTLYPHTFALPLRGLPSKGLACPHDPHNPPTISSVSG